MPLRQRLGRFAGSPVGGAQDNELGYIRVLSCLATDLPTPPAKRYTNFGTRLRSLLDSFAQFTSLIYPLLTRVDGTRPRFPCSASAEVTSDNSVELTRVTELSRYGCYLETARHRERE
jgi:hypothetical protein